MHRLGNDVATDGIFDLLLSDNKENEKTEKRKIPWGEINPEMYARAFQLLNKPRDRMPAKELLREVTVLKNSIHTITNRIDNSDDKIDYFSKTNRGRDFFKAQKGGFEILMNELFGLPRIYNFKTFKPLLENRINDKIIYLLGGGDSMMDLLTSKKLTPKAVINIDPYLTQESIKKNSRQLYTSIPISAESTTLTSELEKQSIPKADEIWATYSVPVYLETKETIHSLFKNIDTLLAKNGTARIYPLALANFYNESEKVFKPDSFTEREDAVIEVVKGLIKTDRYNLDIISGVMHLQKMSE
jgi:hypothetical protein